MANETASNQAPPVRAAPSESRRILIIDDDEGLRSILSRALTDWGFGVLVAADAKSGLEQARRDPPELVLCDVHLPQGDGFELMEALRRDRRTALIPCILMTGLVEAHGQRQAMDLGADDYLAKPFSLHDLRSAVLACLAKRELLRRRAAEELRESRHIVQLVLDTVPQRVFWKDRRSVYLGCNRAFAEDAGFTSPEELIGRTDFEARWREYAEVYRADDRAVMEQGIARLDYEELMPRGDGTETWVRTSKIPLRDAAGRVTGVVGCYEDTTSRRQAESRLIESSRASHFAARIGTSLARDETLPRGLQRCAEIMVSDLSAVAALIWSCKTTASPVEIQSHAGLPLDPEDPNRSLAAVREFATRIVVDRRLRINHPTSGLLNLEAWQGLRRERAHSLTACPLMFGEHVVGVLAIFLREPLSEPVAEMLPSVANTIALNIQRRRAEHERHLFEIQLRQSQKLEAIGQLAAGIAHEINSPTQYIGDNVRFLQESFGNLLQLATRIGPYLDAVREGRPADSLRGDLLQAFAQADLEYAEREIPRAIEQTLDGVDRVTRIVNAMKDLSHPGREEKSTVDLHRAIESTLTVTRNEWKYVADVVTSFDPDLPLVPCRVGEFNQAILNIVVNAAHAIAESRPDASKGKGTITVSTRRAGDQVEIRIADTGTGIPERVRDRIFDPFFTTKPVGKGTGQGLAIARSVIVDKHGGTIDFESETGRGTTFVIRLPLAAEPAATRDGP